MTTVSFNRNIFNINSDLMTTNGGKKKLILIMSDIKNQLEGLVYRLIDYDIEPSEQLLYSIIEDIKNLVETNDNIILQQILEYIVEHPDKFDVSQAVFNIYVSIPSLGGGVGDAISNFIYKCIDNACKIVGIRPKLDKILQDYLNFLNGHLSVIIFSKPMQEFLNRKKTNATNGKNITNATKATNATTGGAKKTRKTTPVSTRAKKTDPTKPKKKTIQQRKTK